MGFAQWERWDRARAFVRQGAKTGTDCRFVLLVHNPVLEQGLLERPLLKHDANINRVLFFLTRTVAAKFYVYTRYNWRTASEHHARHRKNLPSGLLWFSRQPPADSQVGQDAKTEPLMCKSNTAKLLLHKTIQTPANNIRVTPKQRFPLIIIAMSMRQWDHFASGATLQVRHDAAGTRRPRECPIF